MVLWTVESQGKAVNMKRDAGVGDDDDDDDDGDGGV